MEIIANDSIHKAVEFLNACVELEKKLSATRYNFKDEVKIISLTLDNDGNGDIQLRKGIKTLAAEMGCKTVKQHIETDNTQYDRLIFKYSGITVSEII